MLVDLGDGLLDDVIWTFLQFAKYQGVGEGLGEALVVDHRTVNSKGCSSFVFIVKDGIRKESFETYDVFVRDVVVERGVVGVDGPLPEFVKVYFWQ